MYKVKHMSRHINVSLFVLINVYTSRSQMQSIENFEHKSSPELILLLCYMYCLICIIV